MGLIAFVAFMSRVACAGAEFPTAEVSGTWTGRVEIFGPYKVEAYPSQAPEDHQDVVIAVETNGVVKGSIGGAVFVGARISRNRGWLGRKLNLKTDYIVEGGTLKGKVTPKDPGTESKFTIPFDIVDGSFRGTIMLLPKFPLTRELQLRKQEQAEAKRE